MHPQPFNRLEKLFGLSVPPGLREQTFCYLELLRKWGEKINLTSCRQPGDVLRHHFFESFWVAKNFVPDHIAVADAGTGAGFPGVPIKLYRPSIRLVLIEKSHKKAAFLREVCRALGVEARIEPVAAEDFRQWAAVDVVTVRALRPSPALLREIAACGLRLLVLHGARHSIDPALFVSTRRERVPGSENRYASLFVPGFNGDPKTCFT